MYVYLCAFRLNNSSLQRNLLDLFVNVNPQCDISAYRIKHRNDDYKSMKATLQHKVFIGGASYGLEGLSPPPNIITIKQKTTH